MGVKEILSKYAEKFNRPLEELETEYQSLYEGTEGNTDGVRRRKALNKLTNAIKRDEGISLSTTDYQGIILGATDPEDTIENSRRIAGFIYKKDPQRATDEGYTNEDGVVLDRRDRVLGQPNENKGLPLQGQDWRRTVLALARRADLDEPYKWTTIRYYGKLESEVNVVLPRNKVCTWRAIDKGTGNEQMTQNASQVTKYQEADGEIDVIAELERLNKVISPKNVEDWYDINKKDRNAILVTRGTAFSVRKELNQRGKRSMSLSEADDTTLHCNFSLSGDIPLDFEEDSEVVAFGKPRYSKTGTNLWFDALGVYEVPDHQLTTLEE